MSAPMPKVSACVDCATPIIGDQARCPACHARHVADLAEDGGDATVPRPRVGTEDVVPSALARWVVTIEVVGAVVLGLILVVRGCSS